MTLWTVAHQAPLSMGFSRQEYWSGLPLSTSGDLPDPGIKPGLLLNPLLHCWMLPTIWHMLVSLISFLTNFTPTLYSVMYIYNTSWASLVAQLVNNPPAMQETLVQFLGQEDALQKGLATHSSILVWRIPMDRGAWWATVHGVSKSWT